MNFQEKAILFGRFLFCEVKCGKTTISMQSIDANTGCVAGFGNVIQLPIEDCKLVLKNLKTITRKEAMRCAELSGLPESLYKNWQVKLNMHDQAVFCPCDADVVNYRNMIIFDESKLNWSQCDYLRNCGYAIGVDPSVCIIE